MKPNLAKQWLLVLALGATSSWCSNSDAKIIGDPNFAVATRGDLVDIFFVDIPSFGGPQDPLNYVQIIDLNELYGLEPMSNAWDVLSVGWNLTIFTEAPGLLIESRIEFDDDDDLGDPTRFRLTPGLNDAFPGEKSYATDGQIMLSEAGLPPLALDRGLLRIEWNERVDSFFLEDAFWEGRVTLQVAMVPAPAGPMVLIGFAMFAATRRQTR